MFPVRVSIITYNLWNTLRWPARSSALGRFTEIFHPDILCVQELRLETQSFLDKVMPHHSRVHDDFPGWTCEGNIYWNSGLFDQVSHGVADVGILEENRRLFWVRLKLAGQDRTIFVSTAHFTWQGHPRERETGLSPRVEQARRTVEALESLVLDGEPAFFMGDLNDVSHPVWILQDAGYIDCFASLGLSCPPTVPTNPTANIPYGKPAPSRTYDWIVSNAKARAVAAQVPHYYLGDMAPSDHWPVLAVYEI